MADVNRILLIEDDQFLSSLLKNRLKKEGFDVTLVKDGEEALITIKSAKFDLILLDIILPKKSGFEVLEEIRQDPEFERVPVMVLSNLGQPEDIAKGEDLGTIEYFVKAKTSIDDLVLRIKEVLKLPKQ